MSHILEWIDLIWLPLGLLAVHKQHRLWAIGFFICSMVMMRMQVEFIESTGYANGFTGLIDMDVHSRGQLTYSLFYMAYIALAIYSPGTKGTIFMAATISIFFTAMFVSSFVMVI